MAKTAGVVEINGRRYNAVTGAVVGSVMDGFVRRKASKKPKTAQAAKDTMRPKHERPARAVRQSAKSVHKRTEHSNTLLRSVLIKPSFNLKRAGSSLVKSSGRTRAEAMDSPKLNRAKSVKKHTKVERFGIPKPSSQVSFQKKILSGEVLSPRAEAKKQSPSSNKPLSASAPMPSMVASSSHARLERLLDEALLRADAHKQALRHTSRGWFGLPKWLIVFLIILVILAIGAVVIWRDVPAVAVKVAAMRSHVSATVPTYTPPGFGFNQTVSQPGQLTIQYQEKSVPSSSYTVTEQKSDWDSQSLSDNAVSKNSDIQTTQVNGNTVYIYGPKSNAAWVNNGTLYTIKNNANLNSDQLLHIAQGL